MKEEDLFITTVMSCYDRKLEASRRDFRRADIHVKSENENESENTLPIHDVDCVLSSQEIFELIEQESIHEHDISSSSYENQWKTSWLYPYTEKACSSWNEPFTSSGSILFAIIQSMLEKYPSAYLQYVFRA